jgi:hypothetical protein
LGVLGGKIILKIKILKNEKPLEIPLTNTYLINFMKIGPIVSSLIPSYKPTHLQSDITLKFRFRGHQNTYIHKKLKFEKFYENNTFSIYREKVKRNSYYAIMYVI